MAEYPKRHALARAELFLALADQCTVQDQDMFEAYLEASIIFARTAIHRLQSQYEGHPQWTEWFDSLRTDPAVTFFRVHRNFALKEGPLKVGQIIGFGGIERAAQLYHFEHPSVDASDTVRKHLAALAITVRSAEAKFKQ